MRYFGKPYFLFVTVDIAVSENHFVLSLMAVAEYKLCSGLKKKNPDTKQNKKTKIPYRVAYTDVGSPSYKTKKQHPRG